MGNCAIKPKVLKDSDEDLIPVERDTTVHHNKDSAEKSKNNASNAADEEAAAARRSEKGKEIMIEDDVDDEHSKRQSLSLLFHEDKAIKKELTGHSPTKPETNNNKSDVSSEVSKLGDVSAPVTSNVKAPETFDVQTRDDLHVKIPKDSKVKTPETPKAKEAEEQEVNYSENWEVKFPEEADSMKKSEAVKVVEESKPPQVSKVSDPNLPQVKVTKEPEVMEYKNVSKVYDVSKVLEDKNVPKVSKGKTNEVKAAASELLKVAEVKSSEDLEINVPKVLEMKTPEVKTDQEASKVKNVKETAQEKIDRSEARILEDIKLSEENVALASKTEEAKQGLSFEKKVKGVTLSDLDNT